MTVHMRAMRLVVLILVGLSLTVSASGATDPATAGAASPAEAGTAIPYQGRLTGDDGQAVADGVYGFTFTLYEAESGGPPLWTERIEGVAVRDGYFSVLLGATAPLGVEIAAHECYLAVAVRGPGDADLVVLEPRHKLVSPQASVHVPNCGTTADHDHCGDTWTCIGGGLSIYGEDDASAMLFVENSGASGGSNAVWGYATAASGQSHGIYGQTNSETSGASGVYGLTQFGPTTGVYGRTFSSSDWATGVYGYASAAGGMTVGVSGQTDSSTDQARAVFGYASASSGQTRGVAGIVASNSDFASAVRGEAQGSGGRTYGVYGRSNSDTGRGVYGYVNATSGSRFAVGGDVNGTGYGLYSFDDLYVSGTCVGCTMVFFARNAGTETLQVGDVVAASGVGALLQGHSAPVIEVRPAIAGDLAVLGVVYSRGEFYAATGEGPEDFGDTIQPAAGEVAPGDYLLIVTSGLAQVRVAPGLKALTPGQELAVGELAGRATLAGAGARLLFARSMEAEADENGLVWAMVGGR